MYLEVPYSYYSFTVNYGAFWIAFYVAMFRVRDSNLFGAVKTTFMVFIFPRIYRLLFAIFDVIP